MGAKSSVRVSAIRLIAVHTNEGQNPADVFPDRTAENLAAYMDRPGIEVSYHKVVDDDSVVHYLPDSRQSWSLRSGNPISLNVCFTGYAAWTRNEWMRHTNMLRLGAGVVAKWCIDHRIPAVKLSSSEVGNNRSGVCGHVDWTNGKHDGNHTDPGPNFPWDYFMGLVRERMPGGTPTTLATKPILGADDMSVQNFPLNGKGSMVLICPVGKASGFDGRMAELSASLVSGTGWIRYFAQADTSGMHQGEWKGADLEPRADNVLRRPHAPLQDGVTKVVVHWDMTQAVGGTICLETKPTK